MGIKHIIVFYRAKEGSVYKLNGYILPMSIGGVGKNVVQNIDILKNNKISLVILGINKLVGEGFTLGINLIPMPLSINEIRITDVINFLRGVLSKPLFKIKGVEKENTVVILHGQFIQALLIKLFQPKLKVILILEGTYKALAWSVYINNPIWRFVYFLASFFSISIVDKIMTDKDSLWLLRTKIKFLRNKTYLYLIQLI